MRRAFALLLVIAGTAFLFTDVANVWGRLALACMSYTAAFRAIAREPGVRERLGPDGAIRGWAVGSIVASVLFGVASYQLHEPIGWLFMFLSLRSGLWAAWALRMTRAARLVMLALVVGNAGCGTPTSPDQVPSVTLQAALSGTSGAPVGATSPPTVSGEQARIVVLGLMSTPDPCQAVSASASKSGSQVTIKLIARSAGGVCVAMLGEFAYRAVTPVSPGTYTVEVVHEYPGTGWPTSVVRKVTVLVY